MKKITQKRWGWLLRIQRRRWPRERRRRSIRRARQAAGALAQAQHDRDYPVAPREGHHQKGLLTFDLPEVCSLTSNPDSVLKFFQDFRDWAIRRRRRAYVDFRQIRYLGPAAALVIAAELDRWRVLRNMRNVILDHDSWDPGVRQQLFDMGLPQLLEAANIAYEVAQTEVQRLVKFRTGNAILGRRADELLQDLWHLSGIHDESDQKSLFGGLTEAMANVAEHAYPPNVVPEIRVLPNRWWMCGAWDPEKRLVSATFFDQGVGIPATLPKTHAWEQIREWLARLGFPRDDAHLIKAATELGRTRTGEEHRGKGLRDVLFAIKQRPNGRLRILSGLGEYIYAVGQPERFLSHPTSIGGTFIHWEFGL